jgi:Protein of unknown function (DUF3987)
MSDDADFLATYMDYTKKQESPGEFHLFTAMTLVGAALGRKCYMNRGYYKLYPNFFTILVAGSARCRKSTAINIGIDLIKAVPTLKVVKGKTTPERFIQEIEPVSGNGASINVLVHSSELSVFLSKQQYSEPLIHLLTDLYDCPNEWTYKTKNKGENTLRDVFLAIIAATTPDGVSKGIPPSALEEGFASRVLFVYRADTDRRNAMPELTEEEVCQREYLRIMLTEIGQMEGEFKLEQDAREWFIEWYNNMEQPSDKRMQGFFGRKHDHLLRFGMVMAASSKRMLINIKDLEGALTSVELIETTAPQAFSEIGGDQNTTFMSRAIVTLQRRKRIAHSELLRLLYPLRADMFKAIMETLIESCFVKRDETRPNIYIWLGDDEKGGGSSGGSGPDTEGPDIGPR